MTWSRVRLDRVATEVRETVDPRLFGDVEVEHYSIPALDATGLPEVVPASEIMSGKQRLRGGEVLVSRLNPRKARVLTVPPLGDRLALSSGEFIVFLPSSVEPRFLNYVLLAESTRQFLDARVQSVTRSHQRVRPEHLTKMWIDMPDAKQQRAIADFLDAETARIDALIAKRRRMVEVLDERRSVQISALVFDRVGGAEFLAHPLLGRVPLSWSRVRLRYCAAITVGVVVNPSSYFVDEGVPFIHGSDVRDGWIDTSRVKRLSAASNDALSKSRLREGDVVVVRAGYPGRAAVIPPELDGSNCASILILRPTSAVVPEFLCHFLNSREARVQVAVAQYGAAQEQINVSDIVDFVAPLPPLQKQAEIVRKVDAYCCGSDRATDAIVRQIELLVERRQGLITAAVTGELEIPGVAA